MDERDATRMAPAGRAPASLNACPEGGAQSRAAALWERHRARPRFGGSADDHPPVIVSPTPADAARDVQRALAARDGAPLEEPALWPFPVAVGDFVVFDRDRKAAGFGRAEVHEYARGDLGRVIAAGPDGALVQRLAGVRNVVEVAAGEPPPLSLAYAASPSRAAELGWPGRIVAVASPGYVGADAVAFRALTRRGPASDAPLDLVWDVAEYADERAILAPSARPATREAPGPKPPRAPRERAERPTTSAASPPPPPARPPRPTMAERIAERAAADAASRSAAEEKRRTLAARLEEARAERAAAALRRAAEREAERLRLAAEADRHAAERAALRERERAARDAEKLAEREAARAAREAQAAAAREAARAERLAQRERVRGEREAERARLAAQREIAAVHAAAERILSQPPGRTAGPADALSATVAYPLESATDATLAAVEMYVDRYREAAALADERLAQGFVRGTTRAEREGRHARFPRPPVIVARDPEAFAAMVRAALVREGLVDETRGRAPRGRASDAPPAPASAGDLVRFTEDCPQGRYVRGDLARVRAAYDNGRIDVDFHIAERRKTGITAVVRRSDREPVGFALAYALAPGDLADARWAGEAIVVPDRAYTRAEREAVDRALTARAERGERSYLLWDASDLGGPAGARGALVLDPDERALAYGYERRGRSAERERARPSRDHEPERELAAPL